MADFKIQFSISLVPGVLEVFLVRNITKIFSILLSSLCGFIDKYAKNSSLFVILEAI